MLTEKIKCKAIATEIEVDLRNWISNELLIKNSLEELSNSKVIDNLKYKSKLQNEYIDDEDLINYLDFGQCLEILKKNKKKFTSDSLIIYQDLEEILISMKEVRDRSAHGNLIVDDIDTTYFFIKKINKYKDLFRHIFKEIDAFSKPDYLKSERSVKNLDKGFEIENNLPDIDYDETGFIGRLKVKKRLSKTLDKNSIIVLTGDAGIGKTAITLDICHELKRKKGVFDEIKWFTFKSQKFTNNEIKELNNSFLKKNENQKHSEISNLLNYIKNKKCLLILDNLETILDQKFRDFLDQTHQIDHNSKFIITSREPVESGVTIKIEKFDDNEAESLFRKYSNYLNLDILKKKNSLEIKKLNNMRENNPLGIKLSLDDIYNGNTINKAFEPSKNFLNYSYKNIFEKLSIESKKIIEMLFYLDEEFTLTSICTYTGLDPDNSSKSLQDLDKKRFLLRDIKSSETEYFSLRNVIRNFLIKNNIFHNEKFKKQILMKRAQIKSVKSERPINYKAPDKIRYDWSAFYKRKSSDDEAINDLELILKKILSRVRLKNDIPFADEKALEKINSSIHSIDQEIMQSLNFLKKKHPNYCEVFRVEGIFYGHQGSKEEMKNSFNKAFNLAKDYPNPRGFFIERLRDIGDTEASLSEGIKALELFPNNIEIKFQLLQSKYFARNFDDLTRKLSLEINDEAYKQKTKDNIFARKLAKTSLEYYRRFAEFLILSGGDENYNLAFNNMKDLMEKFHLFENENLVDYKTTHTVIKKSFGQIIDLKKYFVDKEKRDVLIALQSIFEKKIEEYIGTKKSSIIESMEKRYLHANKKDNLKELKKGDEYEGIFSNVTNGGAIVKLIDAFIRDPGGKKKPYIFIHHKQLKQHINIGTRVRFQVGEFNRFLVGEKLTLTNKKND